MSALGAALVVGLAGAAVCALLLVEPDWSMLRTDLGRRAARLLAVERAREDLAQASAPWLAAEGWIALRLGGSLLVALVAYLVFGVLVLALVGGLATYHLLDLALGFGHLAAFPYEPFVAEADLRGVPWSLAPNNSCRRVLLRFARELLPGLFEEAADAVAV